MIVVRPDSSQFKHIVEAELGVELPDSYVSFIEEIIRERDSKAVAECFEIACRSKRVIEMNRLIEKSQIEDWPDSWLAVGESGCGDFYAIDLDDEYSGVYFWNHESGTFQGDEDFPDLETFGQNFLPRGA